MGSFTTNTANVIMASIFPYVGGTTTGTIGRIMANTAVQTGSEGFRIYASGAAATTANGIGIYAGLSGAAGVQGVAHAIYLIRGANIGANTGPGANPITDTNFASTGLGLAAGTTTTSAGALTFTNNTDYPSTQQAGACQIMGSTTIAANAWSGWFLGASGGLPAVTNNGQITFATMTAGSTAINIVGFAITATPADLTLNSAKAPNTTANIIAAPGGSTTALPAIIAYGDLNTFRSVQGSDTPVFTGGTGTAPTAGTPAGGITANGAIVITLD